MCKHLRRILVPALMIATAAPVFAEKIGIDEAKNLAVEFLNAKRFKTLDGLTLEPVGKPTSASSFYVFNVNGNKGFVIISAESATSPVLGYSMENGYPSSNVPGAMSWMMEGIEKEVKAAPSIQQSNSLSKRRSMLQSAATRGEEQKQLSTANWSQEGPFNNYIPGKHLVGCVGTAMATIMKYYEWPKNGTGSFDGVDFSGEYNWSEMRTDNYRNGYSANEADAVATLMYHASKSIDTQYGMSGSSAYEVKVPAALSTFFSYDGGVSYKRRSDVATQAEWDNIVKHEIDEGRPVLYCGQDVTAGHAFICDGYQGDYLHFNWGWGGSANGYFLSTALNPTVSRTHHYNNLNTIIYNIKPGAETGAAWSALHITTEGNQVGIGSDLTDLKNGQPFQVRVGNLKNLSYSDFSGLVAVALCDKNGKMKSLLSKTQSLNLPSLGYLFNGYVDFKGCQLPTGVSVAEDDKVCIVTLASGETEWLPVAGELPTINELATANVSPASFKVTLPVSIEGVTVTGAESVIRGWNYTFNVLAQNGDEDVVTVKANGQILTPDANHNYSIINVRENQIISILVQKASDVKAKRCVWVENPGTLSSLISEGDAATLKELTLFGTIDARDMDYIRKGMKLTRLDMSGVYVAANGSNQANAIPREAFKGCSSLKEVVLPNNINRLNNGCFRQSGITTITIPASVKTYEYNIFAGATALRDIYVGRETAEFINWCVLTGTKTNLMTLHVPSERAAENYRKAEYWSNIANIIVDKAVASDKVLFAVAENEEVGFECGVNPGNVNRGEEISFSAKHIADNDNRMEVYANNILLTPDASGKYSAKIDKNTIIHFDLVAPIATDKKNTYWTLTSKNGSVGLISEAVNVIPGQEFTVRVNALNVPKGYEQFYWGIVLADANGDIKEFISPVNVWTAGAGDNWKMNVNCKVNSADVRQGNTLRLVTSANRKIWNLVKGNGEEIVDALPAVNNSNRVFNINIHDVADATVTGAVSTAIKGQDITLKISPNASTKRIDLIANGKTVVKEAQVVNYTFVAMEDMDFEIKVYNPKESGSAEFNVAPGELYKAVTAQSVRATVVVTGETYASDLGNAFRQDFAQKTIKKLDLSGLKIVADPTNGDYPENMIPAEMFYRSNGIGQIKPVVEEILLPNSVTRIGEGAFKNCYKLKEITLPENLSSGRIVVGKYSSGSPKYGYPIGAQAFDGCDALTTIYIPGPLATEGGRKIVNHFNPAMTEPSWHPFVNPAPYNLGHRVNGEFDASQITIVVPEEYLNIYKTSFADPYNGNPWAYNKYNIVAELPVFALNFDPTRCTVKDSGFDVRKAASFLGADVKSETVTVKGKLALVHPEIKSVVYDNGVVVNPDADGTYPITYHNPAISPEACGDHNIEVVYLLNVEFEAASPIFKVSSPESLSEVTLDQSNPLAQKIEGIAENGSVKFKVNMNSEDASELEQHVMNGMEELIADSDGYYSVNLTDSNCKINLFATPKENAVLTDEALAAINPEETSEIENVTLKGEITTETLAMVKECFPNAETIDLSQVEGELPDGAFAGMDNITTVILPEITEIGKDMFNGCNNLNTVEIPASVSSIKEGAFKDCTSLENITLTGVSFIGADAFSGCDNLTSVTLLAGSSNQMQTRAGNDFDAKAFNGLNPNCVIVVDEGVEAPEVEVNFLFTRKGIVKEVVDNGQEVEMEGRVYVATRPMTFKEGYPMSIPFEFTIADGGSVNMEIEAGEWKGLVVPFDVETITDAEGEEVTLITGKMRTEAGCMAMTTIKDQSGLEAAAEIKANHPYIFAAPKEGRYTLSSKSGKVVATPGVAIAEGKDFNLMASYKEAPLDSDKAFFLNSEATAFEPKVSDDGKTTASPFEVYASNAADITLPEYSVQSGVDSVKEEESLKVVKEGTELVIYSPEATAVVVYTIDGKQVRTLTLAAGRNVIEIEKGMYVICGNKIVI